MTGLETRWGRRVRGSESLHDPRSAAAVRGPPASWKLHAKFPKPTAFPTSPTSGLTLGGCCFKQNKRAI